MNREKQYFRLILGKKHIYASNCFEGGFVGSGWFADEDLTGKFPKNWRDFNKVIKKLDLNLRKFLSSKLLSFN